MFGLGWMELLIILVIVLVLFGAGKLPEIGTSIGKGIKNFKKATKGEDEIDVTPEKEKKIEICLKYGAGRKKIPAILELKRVSRPGRRVYVSSRGLAPYVDSLGLSVLSTPQGVMTAVEAQEKKLGGEVLCTLG